jgi:hypothetical protein
MKSVAWQWLLLPLLLALTTPNAVAAVTYRV